MGIVILTVLTLYAILLVELLHLVPGSEGWTIVETHHRQRRLVIIFYQLQVGLSHKEKISILAIQVIIALMVLPHSQKACAFQWQNMLSLYTAKQL